ncbi:MAG TPA: response regulator transcription factor [Bryobacteraceae bacterium]|nr:response regulator transcription factor [Bryobacteraceae bacterium]
MQIIAVLEHDDRLRDAMRLMLGNGGLCPVLTKNAAEGLKHALAPDTALVVTDLEMPDPTGQEVCAGLHICRRLRENGKRTPAIVLSAIGGETDAVRCLENGADDYLRKPFSMRELLARIRALLRRSAFEAQKVREFGDMRIDLTRGVFTKRGEEVNLTRIEYNLLTYFLQNPDRVLTRTSLLNSVWGYDAFPRTRTVDIHVGRLRQKLEADANNPRHLLTVHGVGYRFLP